MITEAVLIPFLQAGVTGLLCGGLAWMLCALIGWPVMLAAILGGGATLTQWLLHVARYQLTAARKTGELETITSYTLPAASEPPATIDLHLTQEDTGGYMSGEFLDRLPVSDTDLATLAALALSGRSLTTAAMSKPAGPFERAAWEVLRDRFIQAELLAWRGNNRKNGLEMTGKGKVVFGRLAGK